MVLRGKKTPIQYLVEQSKGAAKGTVSNGFFTVDQNWTVRYWNKAAEKLIGVPSEDIIGKNLWKGFKSVLPTEFYKIFHGTFLKESLGHFEEYLGVMGNWFDVILYHCDDTISVSFKSNYLPGKIEDLQQQLSHLAGLYRYVTELVNDCIWEWDLLTKEIFWIDGGHKRVFGYQIENALVPQSFWEGKLHPDDKERVLAALEKIKIGESEGLWEEEYRFKNRGGDYIYVQDRGKLIHDTALGNSTLIGTTRDISERKILEITLSEERLKKAEQLSVPNLEAQENERFEIANELHENLGQILCAAKMHVELANVDGEKKVEFLKTASAYIKDVIGGIRFVARRLKMPGMNLGLFDSIRFLMDSLNEEQQTIVDFQVFGLDEDDLDETLQLDIYRIVQELVSNISIHSGASEALITVARNRNEIDLTVVDNGQGCDPMKVETGMGITNISMIAQQYYSSMSVISSPGEGYRCSIVLPVSGRHGPLLHRLDDYDG